MLLAAEFVLLLGVLLTTGILWKWWRKNEKPAHRYPPSLPCLPLVGSLPFIRDFNNLSVFFMKKSKELGPIFTLRIGSRLVLTLNSKDAIEKAVVRNASAFSDRPEFFLETVVNPGQKGIAVTTKETEWKKHQQLSLSILKELGFGVKSIMEIKTSNEIEAMIELISSRKGQSFNPKELFILATSNVMMSILVGRRREYNLGLSELCRELMRFGDNFTMAFDIAPFLRHFPSFRKQMKNGVDSTAGAIKWIKLERDRSLENPDEPCFVQSYVQREGPDYDRNQLNFVLRDLFAAGTDTAAMTLLWSLVAMANYQEVQKRLHAEIDSVVAGDQLPTLQDQARLPYVESTILEIFRWRTIVPLSLARETSRDTMVDGYFIPRGTMVLLNLNAVHNDTEVWKDPEVFRPERFLDSENNVIGKDRVISFSMGRRSCLGESLARAEIFLMLTSLLKRFLVLPPEGVDRISEKHKIPVGLVLVPVPFEIRLLRRE